MQSSYNVIKSDYLYSGEQVKVNTNYEVKTEQFFSSENEQGENLNEGFKNISERLLKHAKDEKEKIIREAYEKAVTIEKETYERAYEQGMNNGYEDGYKEAYDKNIEKALNEANEIKTEAIKILHNAKRDYEIYLDKRKDEILDLSYSIAKKILEDEFTKDYGLNFFVEKVLKESRDNKSFIIRVNNFHKNSLEEKLEAWKMELSVRAEIFILEDNFLEEGNAVIELETGKIEVGIEKALESIRKEIF
ncbi:MAG: FliH/SctL family protein [Sarcina sp.]